MAVFRIKKTQDYTVMSNHHLRNKALTLKAKGLLSQMLSLPDEWDFTLKGLAYINREKIDAIREAVKELETAGYITRSRVRDDKGKLRGTEYIIHEQPQDNPEVPGNTAFSPTLENPILECSQSPALDNPTLDSPTLDFPTLDYPTLENPTQLNIDIISIEEINTDSLSTDSIPFIHAHARECTEANGTKSMIEIEEYREIINRNIERNILLERNPHDGGIIGEIVELILETVCSARKELRIAKNDYPAEFVKARFLTLNCEHIEFVIECLRNNESEIRDIKKYLLAMLFNAPVTISGYYTAIVARDFASEKLYEGRCASVGNYAPRKECGERIFIPEGG